MSMDFIGLAAQQLKSEFQRAQDEAVPSAGDLERAAKQLRAEQDAARLRQSAAQTGGINPDQAAQAQRMARQSGLPEGVVERNPDEVAKRLRLQELDQVAQDPAMAAFFSDPSNLKVASDDLLTLRDIADVARSLPAGPVEYFGTGASGAGELWEATGRAILRPVDVALGALGLGKVEDYVPPPPAAIEPFFPGPALKNLGAGLKGAARAIEPPPERQNLATDIGKGVGQLAAQIATLMITGPAVGTGMLFASGADQQATKQREAGATGTAEGDAALVVGGAVTALTERYGLDFIMRKLPETVRAPILKKIQDVLLTSGAEAAQELVEGILQNVVEYAFYNPEAEIFEDFSREALAAGGAAGIMRTIILSASGGKGAARARQQTEKATKDAEALQQINRLAEQSKLRERSPDKFRAFIAGLIEQDRAVDIDAQTATTLFQEVPDLGQFMTPAEVERLTREVALAQQTGADVRMPLATFVKAFVGTPSFDQLAENVRLAEDAPTAREAAEWSEAEAIEQLGRLRDELGEVVSRQDQIQNIYDDVFAQLKAAAVDDVAATKYAAIVTARLRTRAERLGRDPGELWMEQRPLIRRQMEMQGRAFDELDVTLDDLRSKQKITERAAYGDSLIEFLAGRGGLIDEGGELKAMDAHLWHKGKPGRRKLVVEGDGGPTGPGLMGMGGAQKNRLSVDEAARAAWEAGYFPELTDRPDPDALLQAIERELKGGASYAPRNRNDALAGRLEAAQQLDEVMQRLGLDPATATAAEIREAVDRYAREEATADGEPGVDAEGRTLEQTASVRRGRERLKKYGLEAGKKYKTREVAAALEARQREKYGTIEAADRSGDAERKIASWMVEEILFEVEEAKKNPEKSPVGWYSIKFQRGLDNLGAAFPELVSDDARAAQDAPPGVRLLPSREAARTLLTAFVAVTSDGAKVADNLRFAARVYENFRQTGKIDSAFRFGGTRNASMVRNIEMIARLVELHGFDGLSEFLLQKDSVGNLKRMAAAAGVSFSTGYTVDTTMPVSAAMFGPKLGAFWANLMGDTGYLTMDRWWSRTFNRYRGTLLDEPTEVGLQRFKELVTKDRRLNQPVEMMTDDEALALTVDYVKSYKEKGYKNGTEIEKAANTLYKAAFENLKDQPFNAGDRTFMIATTMRTQKMLARRGVNLTIADIQAVLWYYEKRLYGQLGARQTADVSYEDVAKKAADEIIAGRRVSDGGQQRPDGEGAGEQLGTAASLDVADEPGVSEVALDAVDEEFGAAGEGVDGRTFNQPALPDTLDIDGVARPTTNSKGQPIAQTEEGVRAFWRWFGDSKVVDGEGRPLVVYHGTRTQFDTFQVGTASGWGSGIYLTDNRQQAADEYAYGDDGRVIDGYVAISNPFRGNPNWGALEGTKAWAQASRRWKFIEDAWQEDTAFVGAAIRELGFDGIVAENSNNIDGLEVVAFRPEQIKSATGNRGTFDPARPSILEQVEGKMPRGSIKFLPGGRSIITLTEKADLSTFLHELSHGWLEEMKADAQAPGAPADIRADWERIAAYLGIDPEIDEIPTEAHETFARTGEAYFMEGKAPSTDLAGAFSRFKAWLVRIYRTIRELRVPINDEIRGVFDRMLATDEEIATVRGQYRFDALFDAPAAQGMTEAEFRAYRDLAAKAQLEAETEVAATLQADAEREQTEQYREAREAIANEVEAQVRAEPVQRAIVFLRDGTLPDGTKTDAPIKLAAGPLRETYGRKVASRLPRGVTADDGVPADMVATLFGFQSGDELVRSLMAAPPVEGEIRRRLEARLREQFPDARKDGRAHEAAIEALHGEARMRVLEAEFRALKRLGAGEIVEAAVRRKMAGKAAPTEADVADQATTQAESEAIRMEPGAGPEGRADAAMGRARTAATRTVARQQRTDQAAARKIAVDTLSVDREAIERAVDAINGETKVSDMLNAQRWRRAEKAAADAVVDAVASRNWGAAAWHQRQRIIAAHMVRRSAQARKDVEKAIERFSKYLSRKPGPIDADYLEKVRAILQVYQFGSQMSDRRRAILEMRQIARWQAALAEDEQARLEIAPEILAADEKTHYRDMTLDEFMALRDTVENLATIGRTKTRLLRNQAERDLNRTAELVSETILANVRVKARRSREAIEKGVGYGIEKFKDQFFASHRKIENLVREFDGFANLGPVWQAIFKPLQDAQNEETRMSIEAAAAIKTLFERFPEDARKGWRTRTTYYPSVNQSLSKATVISIALNWGNEGNREAIRKGFRWSDQQVQELLDAALTAEDAAFVQSVWDYIDTFWPALSALEKRVKGIAPKKVEASPLRIAGVDMAGGYYPLKYDPDLSERAYAHQVDKLAQNLMSGAVAKASTRTGAAIERVGSGGMPVRLELDVMFEHVAELIHDISHREAILDVARLLDHPSVKGAVLDTKGPQFHRAMKDWVRDIAAGDVPALSWLDKIIQHLRSGVSISAMGWKLTTAMVQPTGFFQSAAALPKGVLAKHVTAFYGAPLAMKAKVDFVRERSVEMRTRANSLDRDIRDTLRRLGPEGKIDAVKRSFFYLTAMMDQGVAVPTWLAAYEVGMEQFAGDEAKAIDYADQLVRTTQSSGLQKDLAAIQRGGPTLKMFTAFYSYFSATYNLMADNVRQMRRPADMPRFVANMVLLTLLPAVATELLMGRGPDEEDRDEPLGWAKWMGATTLKFALSGFVGVRDVVNALGSNFGYAGSPVGSAVEQLVQLGKEIGQGEADRGLAKAAVNAAGPVLHLPSRQAWITAEGIYLWAEGAEITPFEMFVTRDSQKFR